MMRSVIAAVVASAVLSSGVGFALGRASDPPGASAAGASLGSVERHLRRIEATLGQRPACGGVHPVCEPPPVQKSLKTLAAQLASVRGQARVLQDTLGPPPECPPDPTQACFTQPLRTILNRIDRQTGP